MNKPINIFYRKSFVHTVFWIAIHPQVIKTLKPCSEEIVKMPPSEASGVRLRMYATPGSFTGDC